MAFAFQSQLDEAAERRSQAYFATLSEKDQRSFAALEAQRLSRGGIIYIAKLLGVSRSKPPETRTIPMPSSPAKRQAKQPTR